MKIIVVGAGSIVPTAERFGSGIYIETKEANFLIDPGPGVLERLRRINVVVQNLDGVFVTHFHLDHMSDLLPLIMLWAFDQYGNPSLSPEPLRLFGPKGLTQLIMTLVTDTFSYLSNVMGCMRYVQAKEMSDGESLEYKGVKVTAAEVEHYNGLAYRFETAEGTIVYSGDTVPDERLIRLAKGCDVLIHECSFPHERLMGKHTSEKQLAAIVSKTSPKVLVVTHLYPAWHGFEKRILEAIKELGLKSIVLAKDMSVIEI